MRQSKMRSCCGLAPYQPGFERLALLSQPFPFADIVKFMKFEVFDLGANRLVVGGELTYGAEQLLSESRCVSTLQRCRVCEHLTSIRVCRVFSCSFRPFHRCSSSVRGPLPPSIAAIVVQLVEKTCQYGRRVLFNILMSVRRPDTPVSICTNRRINLSQPLFGELNRSVLRQTSYANRFHAAPWRGHLSPQRLQCTASTVKGRRDGTRGTARNYSLQLSHEQRTCRVETLSGLRAHAVWRLQRPVVFPRFNKYSILFWKWIDGVLASMSKLSRVSQKAVFQKIGPCVGNYSSMRQSAHWVGRLPSSKALTSCITSSKYWSQRRHVGRCCRSQHCGLKISIPDECHIANAVIIGRRQCSTYRGTQAPNAVSHVSLVCSKPMSPAHTH